MSLVMASITCQRKRKVDLGTLRKEVSEDRPSNTSIKRGTVRSPAEKGKKGAEGKKIKKRSSNGPEGEILSVSSRGKKVVPAKEKVNKPEKEKGDHLSGQGKCPCEKRKRSPSADRNQGKEKCREIRGIGKKGDRQFAPAWGGGKGPRRKRGRRGRLGRERGGSQSPIAKKKKKKRSCARNWFVGEGKKSPRNRERKKTSKKEKKKEKHHRGPSKEKGKACDFP